MTSISLLLGIEPHGSYALGVCGFVRDNPFFPWGNCDKTLIHHTKRPDAIVSALQCHAMPYEQGKEMWCSPGAFDSQSKTGVG